MDSIPKPTPDARRERRFYTTMAVVLGVAVLAGFSRTYFLLPVIGDTMTPPRPVPTPLVHLHAALYTGWLGLLVLQARLVAAGRRPVHRRVGVAGAVLATLMIVVGALTALHAVARGSAPPGTDPLRFLAIPLFDLVVFAVLIGWALAKRRDLQTHKRLILLATIGLLPPAIARWAILVFGWPPPFTFLVALAFVIPLAVWDRRTRGKLHFVTVAGALVLLASVPLRILISGTDAWLAFATWAVSLVR